LPRDRSTQVTKSRTKMGLVCALYSRPRKIEVWTETQAVASSLGRHLAQENGSGRTADAWTVGEENPWLRVCT
jgi:hypothetical protein